MTIVQFSNQQIVGLKMAALFISVPSGDVLIRTYPTIYYYILLAKYKNA